MPAAPIPANEANRLEALREYRVLDTPPEERFDRLTGLASRLIGAPMALVSLVSDQRQFFKSRVGIDLTETSRDVSFCAHTMLGEAPLVVSDAAQDERFRDNPLVLDGTIRSYAGAPLRTPSGLGLGSLCVLDPEPRRFSDRDLDVLRTLACVVMDELELRTAAERLGAALSRAERAELLQRSFVSNVNHEIRTPLTAVIGFADLLDDSGDDPSRRRELCDVIRSSAERLLAVVEDVLDFARLESGTLSLDAEPLVLQQALRRSVDGARRTARERGIRVEVTTPSEELLVLGDEIRFRQALDRVLDNAVRFGERGVVSVELTAEPAAAGTVEALVRVRNAWTGGLPEDVAGWVEAFWQGDGSSTRREGGVGLGLTIAQRLTALMGGGLTLERDEESICAVLRVRLPGAPAASREARLRVGSRHDELSSLRVLVVEDGPDNQLLLRMLLERAGAKVTVASNGAEALELEESGSFDLILMDLQMPVMDGFEATRRLRDRGFSGPIIAVTANATEEDRRRCYAGGFDLFLTKPVRKSDLYQRCADIARVAA
jgi:signal transduction histidine kinase/CheY-like chemotaxis protein